MFTNVRDTSLDAYDDLQPHLARTQLEVYALLKKTGPSSDREIATALAWQINCLTGRRNELVKMDLVIDHGKRPCRITGRTVHAWGLPQLAEAAPVAPSSVPASDSDASPTGSPLELQIAQLAPEAQRAA